MMDLHDKIMNIQSKSMDGFSPDCKHAYKIGHRDARHEAAEMAASVPDFLDVFDEAFQAEIQRVSNVEHNSHEICKHFAGELRKKIASLSSSE